MGAIVAGAIALLLSLPAVAGELPMVRFFTRSTSSTAPRWR
jgi:hypothetical protein